MPLYRIYNRKNPKDMVPKNGYRSMQIIGYKSHESWDSVTVDSKDYQLTTSRPSFGLQSVATCPPVDLLLVDLFDLLSMPLPCRTTSTFDFDFTSRLTSTFDLLSIYLDPRPVVDPPRLRPSVDPPRLDFHCKEYNNPTHSLLKCKTS
jgi:hypothetical protein